MPTYAGIDLHSSNNYLGIIDDNDQRIFAGRLPNDLDQILTALQPHKDTLNAVVVESTYNWYWLVDGLQANGYPVRLANPSAIKQYEGLKHTDDKYDSFWLAHLQRLGILPTGYIYPKDQRPLRDLLRRRLLFVKHRTAHLLSLQGMIERHLGRRVSTNQLKSKDSQQIIQWFESEHEQLTVQCQLDSIHYLARQINTIEDHVASVIKLRKPFQMLLSIPGIGKILGLTIMLEVGDIRRFAKVGQYASYCCCVTSNRYSNGKKKANNNRRNGNRYLAWAYVEAANFARRYCKPAQQFYQRKAAKGKPAVAVKALSNKLARASYYMMRDQAPFQSQYLFRS